MPSVEDAFSLHQQGNLEQAEKAYRELLAVDAQCADAWQLLGALLIQQNRLEDAIAVLNKAMLLRPESAQIYTNLGVAFSRLSRLDDALMAYKQSIAIHPDDAMVHQNMGRLLSKMKRYEESAAAFESAASRSDRNQELLMSWGIALIRAGKKKDALVPIEKVLASDPNHTSALKALGQCLLSIDSRKEEAIEIWTKLATTEPDNAGIFTNLASSLRKSERLVEAESACRRALAIQPDFFPALCNLGLIQSTLEQPEEAIETLRRAVDVDNARTLGDSDRFSHPAYQTLDSKTWDDLSCTARCQLAALLNVWGAYDEAMQFVESSLARNPNHVDSIMMKSFLYLQSGRYVEGWPGYESRKSNPNGPRSFPIREWRGEDIRNQTLLLHWEQGLGDTLQFVRYCKLVRPFARKVILLVQASLYELLKNCDLADIVIPEGNEIPPFDCHAPIMSLPFLFRSSVETLPREVPYLRADATLVDAWHHRLAAYPGFRIGIAWQGNRAFAFDYLRRLKLEYFERFARIPGVRLFAIQKGDGSNQLQSANFEVIQFADLDENKGAFVDTSALIQNLDLVISPCTAVTHLAGALGKPVWLAKSFAAEWRWMNDDREENPWYPTMRMFRQPAIGDWNAVFSRMESELRQIVKGRNP